MYSPVDRLSTAFVVVLLMRSIAQAQSLPSDPIVFGNGLVTLSGDLSASVGGDDPGFFNHTDYDQSALRMFRVDLTGALKAGAHLTVLGELRMVNLNRPEPYALYLRIHPWSTRTFDVQVGRVPPTFGAYSRRTYGASNPLIGYPLGYQYLTSLRADAVPVNAEELVRMRGRGWLSNFSVGNLAAERGVPIANVFRWDTGVQVHAGTTLFDGTAAVTTGTISNPRFSDDNSGRQFAGRLTSRPATGLVLGVSAARGPFLTNDVVRAAGSDDPSRFTQAAWGADVEYSRGYYLLRAETIVSRWRLPMVEAPYIDRPLDAVAVSIEGRYKIVPGLYAAARFDHLGFSTIMTRAGLQTWEAPVTRIEVGGGYSLQRNLLLKLSYQHNTRDTGRVPTVDVAAAELLFWF